MLLRELDIKLQSTPCDTLVDGAVIRGVEDSDASATHLEGTASPDAILPLLLLLASGLRLTVNFAVTRALSFVAGAARFDAVIAAAFLDLFDLKVMVPALMSCLLREASSPRAYYFPINFDGTSHLSPALDGDGGFEDAFHSAMGCDEDGGARARCGRRLLGLLEGIQAVGAAAWVVRPDSDKFYVGNERYFLECILGFMEGAVGDTEDGRNWVATRTKMLEDGELTYLAHNLDYCGVVEARAVGDSVVDQ